MRERRLIISLSVAIVLPFVILGLLLPTPSSALSNVFNSFISSADCTNGYIVTYSRGSAHADGTELVVINGVPTLVNYDYYRIKVQDSTGNVVSIAQRKTNALANNPTYTTPTQRFSSLPAGTYITATFFDQSSPNPNDPDGANLGSTPPFPLACGGSPGNLGVAYYPPDIRVMATVRVNTNVYTTPSTTGAVAANLTAGQTWFVSTADPTGQFNQIFLGGPNLGWVKSSDITLQGTLPAPAPGTAGAAATNPVIASGTILAYNLRIHSTGSLTSPQIGLAHHGDTYQVTSQQGNWLNISGPGGTGWISADFFQMTHTVVPSTPQTAPLPNNSAPSPAVATTLKALQTGNLPGVVTAYALRLHIAAGLNSAETGLAHQGETYTIIGQSPNGQWLDITGPSGTGWVDGSYISVKGARAQLAVVR